MGYKVVGQLFFSLIKLGGYYVSNLGVLPFDPTISEFTEWLKNKGVNVPDKPGRYPTFGDVSKKQVVENLWDVVIGELYSATYADLLGRIEDDGKFSFHFEKGDASATEILKCVGYKPG